MIPELLKRLRYVLPGLLIMVMVLHALSGYAPPVYAVPQRQPLPEGTAQDAEKKTDTGLQSIDSLQVPQAQIQTETEEESAAAGEFAAAVSQ